MTQSELTLLPENTDTSQDLLRQAMAALRRGNLLKAGECGEKARNLEQSPQVLLVFAAISHTMGRDLDALKMLEQAMQQAPDVANYPDAAAVILLKLGRKTDGIFNLKLGTHLPSDPFLDEIVGDYFGDVKKIFSSFLEDRPVKTASLLIRQGLYAAAMHQLENYVSVSGGDAESFALLTECALILGGLKEAEVALSALSALDPEHPKRKTFEIGIALLKGDPVQFKSTMKDLSPPHSIEEALMRYRLCASSPLLTPKMRGELQREVFKLAGTAQDVPPFDSADWGRSLMVGFMCSGINSVFEGVILRLQEKLPVNLYLTSHVRNPSMQRLRAGVKNVRDVMTVDDETLVEMIRQDQNFFLIDCIGFSQFARPNIWKLRMAPFQLLWSHNLTLLPDCSVYDYQIAGGIGLKQLGKKALDLGPSINYPLPPAEVMGNLAKLRTMKVSREKGEENAFRLLAPHLNAAVLDETLETYCTILERMPKASLAFIATSDLNDPLVRRVLAFADAKGVAGRVDLIDPTLFMQSRYEILHDADLVLDSFPHGNGDLVAECTWIGVPVLTLAGQDMAERAVAAILQSIGISELVATSVDDFVKRAVRLGTTRRELRAIRSQLLNVQKGMNFQHYDDAVGKLVEKIQSLWIDWCATKE